MESTHPLVEEGREAFTARSWQRACACLDEAGRVVDLEPDDLWRLALSGFLAGKVDVWMRSLEALHKEHRERGDHQAAARNAISLGLYLDSRNEVAQANGWFGRAERELERAPGDCPERGYLLLPTARKRLMSGDVEGAAALVEQAVDIAQRCRDADLLTLAIHLEGHLHLRAGRIQEGLSRFDEAMVGVTADELLPYVTGLVYCSVLGACRQVWALGRVREWTDRLAAWCAAQPEMVMYTGECRVYHAEILLRAGKWEEALHEARRALDRFGAGSEPPAPGLAHYVEAEVYRLRGAWVEAEEAYRAASASGYPPQPGMALVRLAQGDEDAAWAAIQRALAESPNPLRRARLLAAAVEIALALGEVAEGRRSCEELADTTRLCAEGLLETVLAQARGAVALAEEDATTGLRQLRSAWEGWRAFGAPYDAARTRVLLGLACQALGDRDGAAMELNAARAEFERLGAVPDVARIDELQGRRRTRDDHGLTRREREVLALVATGGTNRAIAKSLFISEKTVARHVANIFAKLSLSSRAAATAYAYEHDLLER